MLFPRKLRAQIVGALEANIPFAFHAGNTKLPPGKYVIHVLDDSNLEDGSVSALFKVVDAETNSTPAKSELIFNKYGNRYFLAKLFDEGNTSGSQVPKSRYEERATGGNRATEYSLQRRCMRARLAALSLSDFFNSETQDWRIQRQQQTPTNVRIQHALVGFGRAASTAAPNAPRWRKSRMSNAIATIRSAKQQLTSSWSALYTVSKYPEVDHKLTGQRNVGSKTGSIRKGA